MHLLRSRKELHVREQLLKAFLHTPSWDLREEVHLLYQELPDLEEAYWLFFGKAIVSGAQKIGPFLENRWNESSESKNFFFICLTRKKKNTDTSPPTSSLLPPVSWSPRAGICQGSFEPPLNPGPHALGPSFWPEVWNGSLNKHKALFVPGSLTLLTHMENNFT